MASVLGLRSSAAARSPWMGFYDGSSDANGSKTTGQVFGADEHDRNRGRSSIVHVERCVPHLRRRVRPGSHRTWQGGRYSSFSEDGSRRTSIRCARAKLPRSCDRMIPPSAFISRWWRAGSSSRTASASRKTSREPARTIVTTGQSRCVWDTRLIVSDRGETE